MAAAIIMAVIIPPRVTPAVRVTPVQAIAVEAVTGAAAEMAVVAAATDDSEG
jgi:hypothetical protein